jgi:hypothetical protein
MKSIPTDNPTHLADDVIFDNMTSAEAKSDVTTTATPFPRAEIPAPSI